MTDSSGNPAQQVELISAKHILLITCTEDLPHLGAFGRLSALRGVRTSVAKSPTIYTSADVCLLAERLGVDAVVCTNPDVLKIVLESQYDYIPPNTRRGVTLEDYAGSLLTLQAIPGRTQARDFLVLNPLAQLHTVSYAAYVANRLLSKLTNPSAYLPTIPFKWRVYDPLLESADQLVAYIDGADLVAVDIETAVGDPNRRINCVGYCLYFWQTNTAETIVIPFTSYEAVLLVRRINDTGVAKIFQNGGYDNAYFLRWGCPVRNWLWDTQHLFHSWLAELPKRLDFISAFSVRKIRYWKDDGSTGNLHDYYRYNALDCWATLNAFLGILHAADDWLEANYLTEFPLVFPCLHVAMEGILIDQKRMLEVKAAKEAEIDADLERLRKLISAPGFNPNSPPQTLKLFHVLGLALAGTGKAEMLKAKASSIFNEMILTMVTDIREARKLVSVQVNPDKLWLGRIFYSQNPAATDTGRLNSKESPFWCGVQIQNITRGDTVKQFYIADEGWLLCEIDKSQAEARCVGYLSGETKLIELVESDKDYHSWNAQAFFGVPYAAIWDEANRKAKDKVLRDLSKRTNHGANYNMGPGVMLDTMGPKLVSRAKVTLKLRSSLTLKQVCAYLLEQYEKTYPKVKKLYYESIIKRITLTQKLVSPLGWTRRFFGDPASNKRDLNVAVAHEPQNLSVSIVNREFFNIWEAQLYGDLRGRVRIKAQIHDSIFFAYRGADTPAYVQQRYMNTTIPVTGADGITRQMFIPSEIGDGAVRWSEIKG